MYCYKFGKSDEEIAVDCVIEWQILSKRTVPSIPDLAIMGRSWTSETGGFE